jgi:hypothetical protein
MHMKKTGSIGTLLALALSTGCMAQVGSDGDFDDELGSQELAFRRGNGMNKCKDPLGAVLQTMACIEKEDVACATAGYATGFKKYHNGVDTQTDIAGTNFWWGAFQLLDIDLDVVTFNADGQAAFTSARQAHREGANRVRLTYKETVTTLFGQTFLQHEDALVTVDESCKMTVWDQEGDDAEQQAVDDAVAAMIEILFPPAP